MTQTIKQFQLNIENNKPIHIAILLFSIIYPCINIAFFVFDCIDLPMFHLLWIGFYATLLNMILFKNHIVWRIALIGLNIASISIWYWGSLMYDIIRGILLSLGCSIIPFFPFWITLFR